MRYDGAMPRKSSAARVPGPADQSDGDAALDVRYLEHSLGYALAQATVLARKAFAAGMLEPTGLRPIEFSILMLLLGNDGPAPKALSRTLNLPAPNLTPVLDRLGERGLLRRAKDASDGRAQRVLLTPKGRRLAQQAHQRSLTMEDSILSDLEPSERKRLLSLLARLNDPGASS